MIWPLSWPCLMGFLCIVSANRYCTDTVTNTSESSVSSVRSQPLGPGSVEVTMKVTTCKEPISCYLCPKPPQHTIISADASYTLDNTASCRLDSMEPDVVYKTRVVCNNTIASEYAVNYVFKSDPVESVNIKSIGSRSVDITIKAYCYAMLAEIGYFEVSSNTSCAIFRSCTRCNSTCKNPLPSCYKGTDIDLADWECDGPKHTYKNVTVTVDDLPPSTYFELNVTPWYCNETEGIVNNMFIVNGTTSAAEPLNVTYINVTSKAPQNVTVIWKLPSSDPADYTLMVRDAVVNWDVEEESEASCSYDRWQIEMSWNETDWKPGDEDGATQGPYDVVVPYAFWEYEVAVVMTTENKSSDPHWVKVKTLPKSPGYVSMLEVKVRNQAEQTINCGGHVWESYNDVCVTWKEICPRQRADNILSYNYSLQGNDGTVAGVSEETQVPSWIWANYGHNADRMWRVLKTEDYNKTVAIETGRHYTLCMYAIGSNGVGPKNCTTFQVPHLRPSIPDKTKYEDVSNRRQNSTTKISVGLKSYCFMVKPTYGKVISNGFVVSKGADIYISNTTAIPDWHGRHIGYYKFRPQFLDDTQSCERKKQMVIGEDHCDAATSGNCNGPLEAGTTYTVAGFVCTKDGCDRVTIARNVRTAEEPGMPPYNIVAICLGLLCIPLLGFLVYLLFFRDRINLYKRGNLQIHEVMRVVSRPMVLSKLEYEITRKERNDCLLLREEYEDIQHCSKRFSCAYSLLECNRGKNRFADISAYDHSRVSLSLQDDVEGSDYINANFIPGYNREDEFIATQGPLPSTRNDMWRMVWERQVPMLVMLTQVIERGRVMCDQYWSSTPGDVKEYGHVIVRTLSVSTTDDYVITTFSIKHDQVEDEDREVLHMHYLKWPDMTADVTLDSMIHFLYVVRHMLPEGAIGPIVVHCSAGVGRSGTFICLDYIMQFIQERPLDDKLDILKFVLLMRENRCRMVQTDNQYIFIHQCARRLMANRRRRDSGEEVDNIVHAVAYRSSTSLPNNDSDTPRKKPSDENGSVSEGADAVEADMNDEDVAEDDRLIATPSNEEKEAVDTPLASSSTEQLCSE